MHPKSTASSKPTFRPRVRRLGPGRYLVESALHQVAAGAKASHARAEGGLTGCSRLRVHGGYTSLCTGYGWHLRVPPYLPAGECHYHSPAILFVRVITPINALQKHAYIFIVTRMWLRIKSTQCVIE